MTVRTKILIVTTLFLLVALGLATTLHVRTIRRERVVAIQQMSGVLARVLVDELTGALDTLPDAPILPADLSLRCTAISKAHADKAVTHVAVINADEKIAAHSRPELVGSPVTSPGIAAHLRRQQPAIILDNTVYHTLVPLLHPQNSEYIGTVDIGVSKHRVDDALSQAVGEALWLCSVIFVTAVLGMWFLLHQIVTLPLRRLIDQGKKILHGEVENIATLDESNSLPDSSVLRDDIRILARTVAGIGGYVRRMSVITHELACGDVRQHIMPYSEKDRPGLALQRLSGYLFDMITAAAAIAEGDLQQEIVPKGANDELGQTFVNMQAYLRRIAELGTQIADGNVDVEIVSESDSDMLQTALSRTIVYLQEASQVAENIADNTLNVYFNPRSGHDRLNLSFQRMVANLQTSTERLEASMQQTRQQNWFHTGQAELADIMRGEQTIATLSGHVITYIAKYIQAQVGAFYVAHEQAGEVVYRMSGTYAYANAPASDRAFKAGESLIGQAAESQKTLRVSDIPDGHLAITLGVVQNTPRQILVVPCLYEGAVLGVLEFGTAREFDADHEEFLNRVRENIAIAVHTAQSRIKMQELLAYTHQQSENLRRQQEDLRHTNADLEQQAEALHVSEEKLRVQQEELRQTNEELETQTRTLARQKLELNEKNVDLEHARQVLEDKTTALEQSQVLLERKMQQLEQAERYKSEFLANMSHELRTPLNSLLMLAKLLYENKEGNLTVKQQEFAHTILSAGSDLLDLINEVLDLSKVETGKMILNIDEMSLVNLSAYISQNFRHMADARGLYLQIDIDDDLPEPLITDRQRVEQIVKNLVANGLKFTQAGGVTIHILQPTQDVNIGGMRISAEHSIAIAVSDTGIGIPEDRQEWIFEAFQQADETINSQYGGTGLGLSISREFAKLLGGTILLESREGRGSTFTLLLPAHFRQEGSDAQPAAPSETGPATEAASIREEPAPLVSSSSIETLRDDRHDITITDKTLLIIEDHPQFAKAVFDIARERGFKGLVAGDGEAGLQLAFQYKPTAILLDMKLPRMNGWVVAEKLRKNPETRHIPIHFTTGEGSRHSTMLTGSIGFMTRPVTKDELQAAMHLIEDIITFSLNKILLVTDNVHSRADLLKHLHEADLEVSTVTAAQEAYTRVKAEAFDCLIVDIALPNMAGFDLIDFLHQDPLVSYLPIITYRNRELTADEEQRIHIYFEQAHSVKTTVEERVLDEITLFLHQVDAELPEDRQKKLRMLHDRETVFRGKSILLVDDDMRNLYALTSTLEEHQMNVLMAVNGKEALSVLAEHGTAVSLVMMDMMMPEMDGYEAIHAIRRQPEFSRLPIIALTARAMRGDRQKCIEVGANDYLSKPVDMDKLLSLLRVWLY